MKKYIVLLLAAATFAGCYDLDRYPDDRVNDGIFWKTEAHVKQAVMGVYNDLKKNQAFGHTPHLDCVSDIGQGYDVYSYEAIYRGNMTPRSPGYVLDKWKNLYDGIARANLVLQNIDKVELTAEKKALFLGEIYFMRALYYNELLKFYGGVPIYDESVVIVNSYADMKEPRSSAEKVREFILKDLGQAIASLPVKWDAADHGRATKGAAYALRGKVYLYNKEYANATKDFEEIVLDPDGRGYGYTLHPNYAELFTPAGDQAAEMIFAVQNSGGTGMEYGMPFAWHLGTRSTYGSCWNNVMPSNKLVDMYENLDGSPFNWDDYFPGFNASNEVKQNTLMSILDNSNKLLSYPASRDALLEMYTKRDPRLSQNVILPYTIYKGWMSNAPNDCEFIIPKSGTPHESNHMIRYGGPSTVRPYLWRKFVPEYNMSGQITNREHTPINLPLIRYADVLLLLAECYNEGGHQAEAVQLINQVRTRSNMPGLNSGPSFLSASSKEEVFERIMRERAFELAAEGHRYHDLRRWGLAESVINAKVYDMVGTLIYERQFSSRDYLWPIPGTEIEVNPALTNNPGWE